MDNKRLMQLRDMIGYDNLRIAKMFNIDLAEVEAYCLGTKPVPDKIACDLEEFADWSCEVSHTETKRELAKIYLSQID
ncbi:MAG: hypothetical protein AB9919_08180 [Geobacteraceae bacterium]